MLPRGQAHTAHTVLSTYPFRFGNLLLCSTALTSKLSMSVFNAMLKNLSDFKNIFVGALYAIKHSFRTDLARCIRKYRNRFPPVDLTKVLRTSIEVSRRDRAAVIPQQHRVEASRKDRRVLHGRIPGRKLGNLRRSLINGEMAWGKSRSACHFTVA